MLCRTIRVQGQGNHFVPVGLLLIEIRTYPILRLGRHFAHHIIDEVRAIISDYLTDLPVPRYHIHERFDYVLASRAGARSLRKREDFWPLASICFDTSDMPLYASEGGRRRCAHDAASAPPFSVTWARAGLDHALGVSTRSIQAHYVCLDARDLGTLVLGLLDLIEIEQLTDRHGP
ncbi:unnamed protein product [Vitrella brassicaformis CCMP3155]|uniref:Uncharacterized protein n=1 Tax=Vitrella brassicaformis (strain CCMP3155) TaxID=1169540 RepID=A0A0G4FFM8_VITBC|nr:unnamed protein product [Vitrella brassicaformis CCMP3155]|eukprot:CEM11986.1 unnamed protein product [Vitrella brassicaformis CCMP3155]